MLYDPKWEKPEVKADPYSLESLIAWLEKQPASMDYCFRDNGNCLLTQYVRSYKPETVWMGIYQFPHDLIHVAWVEPHTFGDALQRARVALARSI